MKKTVDARGLLCPQPVIKAKKALNEMKEGTVEVLVDNEIAVQNLMKLGSYSGLKPVSEKLSDTEFRVVFETSEKMEAEGLTRRDGADMPGNGNAAGMQKDESAAGPQEDGSAAGLQEDWSAAELQEDESAAELQGDESAAGPQEDGSAAELQEDERAAGPQGKGNAADAAGEECGSDSRRKGQVVVISSDCMGSGDDELGRLLMKGFLYAQTQLDSLPETVLLYNSGAKLAVEGSESAEDLKSLEAQGVEILTCGTCLNYYGLSGKLTVGDVTNMYDIAEKLSRAVSLIRP